MIGTQKSTKKHRNMVFAVDWYIHMQNV